MKNIILSWLFLALLSGCMSTEERTALRAEKKAKNEAKYQIKLEKENEEIKKCGAIIYQDADEIIKSHPKKLIDIPELLGTSGLKRDLVINNTILQVCRGKYKYSVIHTDEFKLYNHDYKDWVYIVSAIKFLDTSLEELELSIPIFLSKKNHDIENEVFLKVLKDKYFTPLSLYFENYIKTVKVDDFQKAHEDNIPIAIELYVFFNEKKSKEKLINWVKYHVVDMVKLNSYKKLIRLGYKDEAGKLLKFETNNNIKRQVGMLLI
jgi:hypothetical protein